MVEALIQQAEALNSAGRVDLYKEWLAYNDVHPLAHAIYYNYSVALAETGDYAGAVIACRAGIAIRPDFLPLHMNLGAIFDRSGHRDKAVVAWLELTRLTAGVTGDAVHQKISALKQIARVLADSGQDAAAEDAIGQSLAIRPDQPELIQHLVALRQKQCKWPVFAGAGVLDEDTLLAGMSPLSASYHEDDPLLQMGIAFQAGRALGPAAPAPPLPATPRAKLRIGYVSSDLREHAVGFALTELFELHDRRNVEVFAYYNSPLQGDPTHTRLRHAADAWRDIAGVDDARAAATIRDDGIDILVDLNGYTRDARTALFACRPAPIAVNWFGFPGTMATRFHDYLIADERIIPSEYERFYSEKVLRLPCYQPNDRKRAVGPRPTRAAMGLPETAFVFCCLNGMQKITAAQFADWMHVLAQVPGVLWLLAGAEDTNARLREAAAQAGIDPARLIFAAKLPNADHLARYPLADLFLDTFPYGAHTTAADALWMGVPVLTRMGRGFASRVCGSLVHAAGIGELATASRAEYLALAVALARDPGRLAALRRRLAHNQGCALFDTGKLATALEALYRTMWHDQRNRPDLRHLDACREAGVALKAASLDDDAYLAAYAKALAEQDAALPAARLDPRVARTADSRTAWPTPCNSSSMDLLSA